MSQKPKLSVTGYRAIWGQDLDEQIAFEYVRAFAKTVVNTSDKKEGLKVLIGRDARKSGTVILQSAKEAFEKEGVEVVYAGIIPTPSMLLLVKLLGYDAGVMITASHNPREYNGVKFIMDSGRLTNEKETIEIENKRINLTETEKTPSVQDHVFGEIDNKEFRKIHIDEVLKNIDVDLIKSKKFKVALDPINSTGSIITQELLAELGCETHVINGEPDGNFAHIPEPLEVNLAQTLEFMKEVKPDVGFIQDPDADRLVLVNEQGDFILEELMISLVIKSVLSRKQEGVKSQNIVVNLSTTRVCEDIVNLYGAKLWRTKVGEANVVEKMIEVDAPIGGEGSGGAIYPAIGYFRDSLSGIGLVLELLARENKKISELISTLPKYFMKKDKFPVMGDLETLYTKLKTKFPDATVNEEDGIRLDWPDRAWVHIRPSNTEPILRIFGEAKEQSRIDSIFNEVKLTLGL